MSSIPFESRDSVVAAEESRSFGQSLRGPESRLSLEGMVLCEAGDESSFRITGYRRRRRVPRAEKHYPVLHLLCIGEQSDGRQKTIPGWRSLCVYGYHRHHHHYHPHEF